MGDAENAAEPVAVIVVRDGAIDRFAGLRAAFAPDEVEVVWDRRRGERRRVSTDLMPSEHRRRDRRRAVPASWALLDFIVVAGRPQAS